MEGEIADLTIFNGHPFSVYSKCVMTMIEGEIFFDLSKTDQAAKMVAAATEKDTDN